MMSIWELRQGMIVMQNGQPVRVEKVKQKRVITVEESGRRWDAWPSNLSPAPEGTTFTLRVEEASVSLGTVIKFKDGRHPGMYVVIGLQAGNTFKATRLFGEGNSYFHNIAATAVEVVSPEDLKAWLSYTLV